MHLTEGQLKAYIDQELSATDIVHVRTHLAECNIIMLAHAVVTL